MQFGNGEQCVADHQASLCYIKQDSDELTDKLIQNQDGLPDSVYVPRTEQKAEHRQEGLDWQLHLSAECFLDKDMVRGQAKKTEACHPSAELKG